MKKEDRRVRKTKKAMTEALGILLTQKPLKNISVKEVAELADINRGTFYLHYRDVYDMVAQIENDFLEQFNQIVDGYDTAANEEELLPMLEKLYGLLKDNKDLAKVLISKNGDAEFVAKLKKIIREKCFKHIRRDEEIVRKKEFGYFYYFIVSGCIGLCEAWLDDKEGTSTDYMARLTEKLITSCVEIVE